MGRAVQTTRTLKSGPTVTLDQRAYNGAGRLTSSTDVLENTTTFEYDGLGRVIETTRPDGSIVTTTYDLLGNRLTETAPHDPENESPPTTTYTYDELNRVVTVTNPLEQITTSEYHADFAWAVTAVKFQPTANDPQTTLYSATFDANGRKASVTRDGIATAYTYTDDGRPLRTTFADDSYTENTYDERLVTAARDRAGNVATFAYDGLGRRTGVTNARSKTTTTAYLANTQLPASVTDPLSNVTAFQYDLLGRRTRTVFPGTEPAFQRAQVTTYDEWGRVSHVDGAKTYPLSYEYDLAGHMTALIDGEGSRTKWEYDSMGRMARKTYADGSDYEYDYDYEGKLVARTDGKGQITEYSYDTLGRLTGIDYPTDTDVVTVYDDLGRRASVTDATGTWVWTYDGDWSRVLTETDPDGNVLTYAYNACGHRTDMTMEVDSTVVQELDYTYSNGRLTGIDRTTGVSPVSFSYSYLTNSNLLASLVSNNGTDDILSVSRTHDDADRLLSIASSTINPQPSTIASFSYTLDATGRRIRRDDLDGTHISYSYNQRDELIGAVRSDYPETNPFGDYPYQYGYQFDKIGNHLKQTKNGTAFTGRYNNLNELMEREVNGPERVPGTADGVLPIGVKVDGAAANTATVDQDTAAWRGDSRPIAPGQTGTKAISVVATDSAQPPKKTESVRSVELPAANPIPFTYDLNGNMLSGGPVGSGLLLTR